jgi:regulator of cell morphogenesis and NO signaling
MNIGPEQTIQEIWRNYPSALPVFAKYRIDLCCGGRHSLEEVAEKHGLDLDRLLAELKEATGHHDHQRIDPAGDHRNVSGHPTGF